MIANLVKKLITFIVIKSNRLNCGGGQAMLDLVSKLLIVDV